MRSIQLLVIATLVAVGLLTAQPAQAQPAPRCFNDVPNITNCIEGRFREYWEQNGGLPVFGYPISAATDQPTAEGTFLVQVFERNRFELHPEKQRPYDVLLGRLGDDRLKQQYRDWPAFEKEQQAANCLFFPETQHNVCNAFGVADFKGYWESHGLQDPALNTFQRSLALFGLPLSGPIEETNANGDTVITQHFERARFEYHMKNPPESRILLGLLGNESRSCAGIEAPVNGTLLPNCVKYGAKILLAVQGFQPNQEFQYAIVTPNNSTVGDILTLKANGSGGQSGTINTTNWSGRQLQPGEYAFVARPAGGQTSVRLPFRVLP